MRECQRVGRRKVIPFWKGKNKSMTVGPDVNLEALESPRKHNSACVCSLQRRLAGEVNTCLQNRQRFSMGDPDTERSQEKNVVCLPIFTLCRVCLLMLPSALILTSDNFSSMDLKAVTLQGAPDTQLPGQSSYWLLSHPACS